MQGVTTVPKEALMLEKKFPHWTQESSNKLIIKFELLLTYEWQLHAHEFITGLGRAIW